MKLVCVFVQCCEVLMANNINRKRKSWFQLLQLKKDCKKKKLKVFLVVVVDEKLDRCEEMPDAITYVLE
jgi:hypothetical protein